MEVSVAYINKNYYKLNKNFQASDGDDLIFDYNMKGENTVIPVLVGKGLSKDYPIGKLVKILDPMLNQEVNLKVQGYLRNNVYHSNMYSLSSKQYYNFSVVVPVNEAFIENSNGILPVQGLFDMTVLNSTEGQINELAQTIQDNLGLKFNFKSQKENIEYFNEYYFSSTKITIVVTIVMSVLIVCLAIWSSLSNIRVMLKDFTINLLVGLSYKNLRRILYGFYSILFGINILILFLSTVYHRHSIWIRKDASFSTFGLFGLISMDWLAIGAALLFNIIIEILIVEIMMNKIKKVPISLGVLQ